ncbi:putative E3 ubiquitin-protein ligaseB-like [Capsicum annuum]|nr:putative E3 ubiquitin-protein ligaseB-like [Capsicum annuum]KAF3685013.1 putative E3 ubiquitin-protein ligaseB-like [Capsicum annuum]
MSNCAELPHDLIAHIANHVKVNEAFIAFGVICTSYGIAATNDNFDLLSPQVPLFMIGDNDYDYRGFYSFFKKKVSRIFLQKVRRLECFSTKGWIYNLNDTGEMNFLRSFSRVRIQLRSLGSHTQT